MYTQVTKKRARAKLTREGIETAAFSLIEREGLEGFSTRKLASDLGCEAMSIYHHFPSKAHLFEALVDRLVESLEMPPKNLPWRERLRRAMEDFRRIGRVHPAFAPYLITYRMNSPTCLRWLDDIIGLFDDGGFDSETAARLFRATGYYLMGAILDETSGYGRGPSATVTVTDEQLAVDFPRVARAGLFFGPEDFDRTFRIGLDLLLDHMDRMREAQGR